MLDLQILTKLRVPELCRRIKTSDHKYRYKKIYIDSGGIGVGVCDILREDDQTKRRVEEINNSSRPIEHDSKRKRKLLKEDLYTNLLRLMEQGRIELFKDPALIQSLKSVQYEYTDKGMKIFGRYTHVTEALIRAAFCILDRKLNIWVR